MRRRSPWRLRRGYVTAVGACALPWVLGTAAPPASAEEALEDHFSRDWYYTEVVIFQRPEVQDHAAEEALAGGPVPLPSNLRSFRAPPGERWAGYPLSPSTRAFLTFPYLDQSLLPEPVEHAQLTIGDPDVHPEAADEPAAHPADEPAGRMPPPPIAPRLQSDPLLDFLGELAAFEAALEADSYRWLEPETFTLTSAARRLARRGGLQVLLHGRWLQPVPPREDPQPLYLQLGPRVGDTFALEGTLGVTLGRYLHFRADLYYTEPLMGQEPLNHALAPPMAPATGPTPVTAPRLAFEDLVPAGVMQLHESRRLRSDELHYLDHPKLGVLVRIQAVAPPPALSAAHAALEEGEQ